MSEVAYMQTSPVDDLWRKAARCIGHDPENFILREPKDYTKITMAKKICAACTVQADCLEDAVVSVSMFEIRAGMTPVELRRERVRRQTAPQPIGQLALVTPLPKEAA